MSEAPYYIRAVIDVHTLPHPELSDNVARELEQDGMIEKGFRDLWKTTPKGKAYVELLCEVPLPQMRWIDPRKENK